MLRAAFNTAVHENLLSKNPCDGVELPTPEDEEIHPLSAEQVAVLLTFLGSCQHGKPHRLRALYHVAIRCGLRLGEIIGLRRSDVDLERCELVVRGQIQRGKRTTAKSKHGHRTLKLSTHLVGVLRALFQQELEERSISGEGWNAAGLVFCSENGTPINPGNLTRQFKALLRRTALPDIRFHDLRHTYAALQIAAGTDIYTLSRLMGHSSISVTADRYGHLYDQGKQQAADALDRLLNIGA